MLTIPCIALSASRSFHVSTGHFFHCCILCFAGVPAPSAVAPTALPICALAMPTMTTKPMKATVHIHWFFSVFPFCVCDFVSLCFCIFHGGDHEDPSHEGYEGHESHPGHEVYHNVCLCLYLFTFSTCFKQKPSGGQAQGDEVHEGHEGQPGLDVEQDLWFHFFVPACLCVTIACTCRLPSPM